MGISLTSDSCKDKEADTVHPGRTQIGAVRKQKMHHAGFPRRPLKEGAHGKKYVGSKRVHDAVWRSTTDREAPL